MPIFGGDFKRLGSVKSIGKSYRGDWLPTITILGSATFHEAATSYADAGATAVDTLGGDLTFDFNYRQILITY